MKVLDLQCGQHHVFEGWFGSEDDYQSQLSHGMLTCPMCGDHPTITKAVEGGSAACASVPSISARDLVRELAGPSPPCLVDVREEGEFARGSLPGSLHLPLGEVATGAARLPRDRDLVVFCSVGPRGSRAAELLAASGLDRVRNLTGGLAAWRDEVDPSFVVA